MRARQRIRARTVPTGGTAHAESGLTPRGHTGIAAWVTPPATDRIIARPKPRVRPGTKTTITTRLQP